MSLVPDNLLVENGIVRSLTTMRLFCAICCSHTSYTTCEDHMRDPSHLQQLGWFSSIFEIVDNLLLCKICNIMMPWDVMKSHSETHSVVYGSKSEDGSDKYKILFENRMIQSKKVFHCCLCNIGFRSCELALFHIADPDHLRREKMTSPVHDCVSRIPTSCEYLVREGLIAINSDELECQLCGHETVALSNVMGHVKGMIHLSLKSKFRLNPNRSTHTCYVPQRPLGMAKPKESNKKDGIPMAPPRSFNIEASGSCAAPTSKPVKSQEPKFQTNHEPDNSKFNNMTIIEGSGHSDSKMRSLANVSYHTGKKQSNSSNKSNPSTKQSKFISNESPPQNMTEKYLETLNPKMVRCKLCDCDIPSTDLNLSSHVTGKSHNKWLKKYGCDKIIVIFNGRYHCECCNVVIENLAMVDVHTKEPYHMRRINASNEGQSRTSSNTENDLCGPKEASKNREYVSSTSTDDNATSTRSTGSHRPVIHVESSNGHTPNDEITAETERAEILKQSGCHVLRGDQYYCVFCKCDVPGFDNVSRHVQGKKHLLRINRTAAS